MRSSLHRLLFWRKPDARLAEFAETEAFGARDLSRAAEQTTDPWMRRQLLMHAQDEVRHAALLGEGQAAATPTQGLGASMLGEAQAADGIDLQVMGDVGFIAFVHVAEKRAVAEFGLHQQALGERGAVFDSILHDEKRHVAWTGHALERFRQAGRGAEVDLALRRLRRERYLRIWLAFARRLGQVSSFVLLSLVYVLAVLPMSLLAGRWAKGWQAPQPTGLSSQH
jgi:hypothetical protein